MFDGLVNATFGKVLAQPSNHFGFVRPKVGNFIL